MARQEDPPFLQTALGLQAQDLQMVLGLQAQDLQTALGLQAHGADLLTILGVHLVAIVIATLAVIAIATTMAEAIAAIHGITVTMVGGVTAESQSTLPSTMEILTTMHHGEADTLLRSMSRQAMFHTRLGMFLAGQALPFKAQFSQFPVPVARKSQLLPTPLLLPMPHSQAQSPMHLLMAFSLFTMVMTVNYRHGE
jgi:hypothetical protein